MTRIALRSLVAVRPPASVGIATLLSATVLFQIISNSALKLSTTAGSLRGFLAWQVVGNAAGFIGVLTITGLMHYLPLSIVFPITTGLTVIGIQVVAARWLFSEPITSAQWLGVLLVVAGIMLIGGRR